MWTDHRVAGHFGEFLQGRIGPEGPLTLVTLPCPDLTVRVCCQPHGPFHLHDPARLLPRNRIRALARAMHHIPMGKSIVTTGMEGGAGTGASTAALIALARCWRPDVSATQLAHLTHRIEGASDPTMYAAPDTHLWVPRSGLTLQKLPKPPAFAVVGGLYGRVQRTDPHDFNFADISDLIPRWQAAVAARDRHAAGAVATLSAQRNLAIRGGASLDGLLDLAKKYGASGIVAAHTGAARGLLFAPGQGADAESGLRELGFRAIVRFRSDRATRIL